MHRIQKFATAVGLAGLLALSLVFLFQPPKQAQAAPSATPGVTLYEKLGGTSAAITSGVRNTNNLDDLTVLVAFTEATSSRALGVNWLASDGTTVLYTYSTTVTSASGTAALQIGREVSNANLGFGLSTTGTTIVITNPAIVSTLTTIPIAPGQKMSFTLAAATGATAGTSTLAVYGR